MEGRKKIYIGYDRGEHNAYIVCRKSILNRASVPIEVIPLRQEELRATGLYWRSRDPLASTEFTYTRFLVPALNGYNGCALFVDLDFLFLADVAELFTLYDPFFAVQCVRHNHQPEEQEKMAGTIQTRYPRKNWTSLMLLNCGHPDMVRNLTMAAVNEQSGAYLHRMQWVSDYFIGGLPESWNWLCGHSNVEIKPRAVHFTRGVPTIHPRCESEPYADLWMEELKK